MTATRALFDSRAKAAFIVACLTLLVSGIGFRGLVQALNVYLQKEAVELRQSLSLISTTLGDWKQYGQDVILDAAMVETLGTKRYLDRRYILDASTPPELLNVHLAYYTGMIDTVPHVPDRCLVAAGFNDKTLPRNLLMPIDPDEWQEDPEGLVNLSQDEIYRVAWARDRTGRTIATRLPVGEFRLRTVEFEDPKQPRLKIFGGYFFIANGRNTPTPEGVKALAFNPFEKYAYYCKVQYVYASPDATEEKFLELVADHFKAMLPELMLCLPDWAEVERRDRKDESAAKEPVS